MKMRLLLISLCWPVLLVVMLAAGSLYRVDGGAILHLERSFHLNARISVSAGDGAGVSFPVLGSASLCGFYYTKVNLGSPAREFKVIIDTGSNVLWVKANTCANCPRTSTLIKQLTFFDTTASSTARVIPCSHKDCAAFNRSTPGWCSKNGQCGYTIKYMDSSATSGFYVEDLFHFNSTPNSSLAPVVFGVSTYQNGWLAGADNAVDGVLGFGRGELSVFSQLSSRGLIPRVFSQCLKGDEAGGGFLVLGKVLEPSMVYTPLVPSRDSYNVELQRVAVNGRMLAIDPVVFSQSNDDGGGGGGTVVDSGTTYAYLVEGAYKPFVDAVTVAVSRSATLTINDGRQCYLLMSSFSNLSQLFPPVSFHFAGGGALVLKAEEYLFWTVQDSVGMWCHCIGMNPGVTILGDIFLKDKIFVYDLIHQRIGWAKYNCSSSVNVTVSSEDFINTAQKRLSSSYGDMLPLAITSILLFLLCC